MKKNTFLIVVISLFLVNGGITLADNDYTPCESITDIPLLECEALVDFYYSTNGNEWTKGSSGRAGEEGKVGRLTGTNAGNWYGIEIKDGHVVTIGKTVNNFNGNNLSGTLNPSLGNLVWLEEFDVAYNPAMGGVLPKELKNWKNIKKFYIRNSSFMGELPPEYAEWTTIEYINIGENNFDGILPIAYGVWTGMKYFYAYGNNFVGNLPEIYGQWSGIIAFAIGNNKFEGTLPISYGAWSHIVDAGFEHNKFVGALPPEYSNWGQWIRLFSVNDNELYGNIPTSYETRSGMVRKNNVTFNIENNMFSGDIPEGLAGIIGISGTLYVGNNCLNADLTGVIGNWVDANASLFNPTMFIGSGRRLMQNHCYVPPTPSIPTPITPTSSGGGGGGSSLSKDTCPTGDFSSSYYDKTCGTTADLADEVAKKVNVLKPLIRFIFLTATEEQKRLVYTLITSCSVNNKKEVIKLACQELVETWEF